MDTYQSIVELWKSFEVAILVSLVGALIGHYKRNACILLPIVSIDYQFTGFKELKKTSYEGVNKTFLVVVTFVKALVGFLLYIIGIRYGENKHSDPILFELGIIGDLMIGVGAGIVAKSTVALSGVENELSVIVASLLAGFAGLSYIQKFQLQAMENTGIIYQEKLRNTEEVDGDMGKFEPSENMAAKKEHA